MNPLVNKIFIDSGAHTLYNKKVLGVGKSGYEFFKTAEFFQYVDEYAEFIKKHIDAIDYYANVDVIYNPELSWNTLKYLEEKHGLKPLPVIHCNTPLSWIDKHLDAGYTYLGIGGLGQGITKDVFKVWADRLFTRICPAPDYLPIVKTHGFAMTAYGLLFRYPWYSVDSATWAKAGGFGKIMVPHKRNGKFVYDIRPYEVFVSEESPSAKIHGKHYLTLNASEKSIIKEWLELIKVPLGTLSKPDTPDDFGVLNRHVERKQANLMFFEKMLESLPTYPWPYKVSRTATVGFGI